MTDKEYLKKLGENIKKTRLDKKIRQVDLANYCDFEKSNMNRIEAGRANTTIITLRKIASGLNVNVIDLLIGLT